MKITIEQYGLEVGPYTLEEAQALLAAGILDEDDPARPEGVDDWAPLQEVIAQLTSGPSAAKAASTTSLISQVTPYPSAFKDKTPAPPTSPVPQPASHSSAFKDKTHKPPTAPISLPASRPTASKEEARSTTGSVSQRRSNPLTAKVKARSAASAATQRTGSASTDQAGSAASASGEPHPSKMNPVVVSCVVAASILVLIPILFAAFAPEKLAQLLEPNIPTGVVSIHMGPTVVKEGDLITAAKTTDASGDPLRDETLELIYSTAKDNPSVNKLKLTLHVTGASTPKDVLIEVDDLATVRTFSDQKAYGTSGARKVIDGDLRAAGL